MNIGLLFRLASLFLLLGPGALVAGAQEHPEEQPSGPYLYIPGAADTTEELPLQAVSARVRITGVIADVTINQTYQSRGRDPIEAIYVFPGSTRAAVHKMVMKIGERTVEAAVKEREAAKQQYAAAIRSGRTASLLEQHRPNVFQMNVGNILPGELIAVEMSYTELLSPEDGAYRFIFPTVVGPRYAGKTPASEAWVSNPYLPKGTKPAYSFKLQLSIAAGMPLAELKSSTHKTSIRYSGAENADVSLDPAESGGGDRDFVLEYRLADKNIASGLLLHHGEKEDFFLLLVQPPKRSAPDAVLPREYIFLMDVSGSMAGFPIETSKELLRNLLASLQPGDLFNVLFFAGGSDLFSPAAVPATQRNIAEAIRMIDSRTGGDGTELVPALEQAFKLPAAGEHRRSVLVITDGYVSAEEGAFETIRRNLGQANVFAFGIGSSVNRHLIEGMAHTGGGEPFVVLSPSSAAAEAARFQQYVSAPLLAKIKLDYQGLQAYDVEPASIPDLFASRPIVVTGKLRGVSSGSRIALHGLAADGPYNAEFPLASEPQGSGDNAALRYLWARERIRLLNDYNLLGLSDERAREVTSLGLTYNLLTQYTSFVAVDSAVRTSSNRPVQSLQPLPLAQGVPNTAVSSASSGSSLFSSSPSTEFGGGGGGLGYYSEASYDDELIRGGLGKAFVLIEGAAWGLGTLVFGVLACLAGVLSRVRRSRKWFYACVLFLFISAGAFTVRSAVSLLCFGADYSAAEAQ